MGYKVFSGGTGYPSVRAGGAPFAPSRVQGAPSFAMSSKGWGVAFHAPNSSQFKLKSALLLANRGVRFYEQVKCPLAFGFSSPLSGATDRRRRSCGKVGIPRRWRDSQAQRLFHSSWPPL